VLTSPRCLNCHQAEAPLRGDDRNPHLPAVTRGPDDQGEGMGRCSNCHKANPTSQTVPGAPGWRMAPIYAAWNNMRPHQLCITLRDPVMNGGRGPAELVKHFEQDSLVTWAWAAGPKRSPPAIPRAELVEAVRKWADAGTPCPDP
jgi:hypothetical protein